MSVTDPSPPSTLLDVHEVAAYLGVSERFVYKHVAEGSLPSHRVGRALRFQAAEIDAWLEAGHS